GSEAGVRLSDPGAVAPRTQREQRRVERGRAGSDGDAVRGAAVGGALLLKGALVLAEIELHPLQRAEDGRVQLWLERLVLGDEVNERNGHGPRPLHKADR